MSKILEYLSTMSVEELKRAYNKRAISWIYILELRKQGLISIAEMNYIVER